MHLKSITLKGFKSFPDRTRLEFGPGVSVIVGPNGSGKSNITDAVLWAMGEQSPLAVRGQSMQDVIFGGGRGSRRAGAAEVELVIDNADGDDRPPEFSEISILRRLDRTGDGEYRLNGARCRLVDVIEVLSRHRPGQGDALGRLPGPRRGDRHLQAPRPPAADRGGGGAGQAPQAPPPRAAQARAHAGQPRPRARRRARGRARACARSSARPRPPSCTSAWSASRSRRAGSWRATACARRAPALASAESRPPPRRARRATRRARARRGRAARARRPRRRWPRARSSARRCAAAPSPRAAAGERVGMRARGACAARQATLAERAERRTPPSWRCCRREVPRGRARRGRRGPARRAARRARAPGAPSRRTELEREVADLERERTRGRGGGRRAPRRPLTAQPRGARRGRRARRGRAHGARRGRERRSRRRAARPPQVGAELAAVNQFLRSHAGAPGGAAALADDLHVEAGYELALAAALGGRLRAAIVARPARRRRAAGPAPAATAAARSSRPPGRMPPRAPGLRPCRARSRCSTTSAARATPARLAAALLADAWVVDTLDALPRGLHRHRGHPRRARVVRRLARAAPGPGGRRGPGPRRAQPPRRADRRLRGAPCGREHARRARPPRPPPRRSPRPTRPRERPTATAARRRARARRGRRARTPRRVAASSSAARRPTRARPPSAAPRSRPSSPPSERLRRARRARRAWSAPARIESLQRRHRPRPRARRRSAERLATALDAAAGAVAARVAALDEPSWTPTAQAGERLAADLRALRDAGGRDPGAGCAATARR